MLQSGLRELTHNTQQHYVVYKLLLNMAVYKNAELTLLFLVYVVYPVVIQIYSY